MIHYVYRHLDADGEILYIGCTSNLERRFSQHRISAKWFKKIVRVTKRMFKTKDEALRYERKCISLLDPPNNRQLHPYFRNRLKKVLELRAKGYSARRIGKFYGVTGAAICSSIAAAERRNAGIVKGEEAWRDGA